MARDLYLGGAAQIKAYRILQTTVADTVKSFGLGSVSEWLMLCHIAYNKHVTGKELAGLLQVEPPLATMLVSNLVAAELVQTSPSPTDKRAKIITATPQAKSLIEQIETALEIQLNTLLKGVTAQELTTYRKVLDQIIASNDLA